MYCLLHRELDHPASRQKQVYRAPGAPAHLVGKYGYGNALLLDKWKTKYSLHLRSLIAQCLMWEPGHRPEIVELQKKVKEGFDLAWLYAESVKLDEENPPVNTFAGVGWYEEEWVENWQ